MAANFETLDLEQAAEMAGLSVESMCHKMRTRVAPGTKIGRCWMVPRDLLAAWIAGTMKMPKSAFRPDYTTGRTTERRLRIMQRMPVWANREAIREVYAECARRSVATGIVHQVDHVVPLRGKKVSGLHVEYNLQVIPATQNISKGNRWE